jgi:hypothetical protein
VQRLLDWHYHTCFEVCKTPYIILKDTHVAERVGFKHVILVEHVNIACEQHIDDLIIGVKQVVLGDWFQGWNLVFKVG